MQFLFWSLKTRLKKLNKKLNIVLFLSIDWFKLRCVHIRLYAFDVYTPTVGFPISGQPQPSSCRTFIYWEANKCLRTHNYDSNANHDSFHHEIELSEKEREREWMKERGIEIIFGNDICLDVTYSTFDKWSPHCWLFFILFIVTVRCLHFFTN